MRPDVRASLQRGVVIPACPLALNQDRKFDERHQRALFRYYAAACAGGVAVGVHTTQFAIREPKHNLFRPLLQLAAEEFDRADLRQATPLVRVAGICGQTDQAASEAMFARECGFHTGLLSLAAMRGATNEQLIAHCREISEIIPLFGFYLQPAVGGQVLAYEFWRSFAEIENVAAIKIAPFNRYQTLDVVRAVADSGRDEIALYTGNDDSIVMDLLTPFRFGVGGQVVERRIVGGLLGHWSVWTRKAVELLAACHGAVQQNCIPAELAKLSVEVTDANAAFFDASHNFAGCIAGLHEVLYRQRLLPSVACLDPQEMLSPGQQREIERVCRVYPHLSDDAFVSEHRDAWLSD